MYLVDHEIKSRLDDLAIGIDDTVDAFDSDVQVGPCSIDLRLSGVWWQQAGLSKRPLHLDRTHLMELDTRRGWHKTHLERGDSLRVRSGQTILCRTAERFTMPRDLVGVLEGRSSYARLGLGVELAGHINPGWSGHMPITLSNHSPIDIYLPVGTPLCQLMLSALGSAPAIDYSERAGAKYANDDGGPSYWWRDALIRRLVGRDLGVRALDELADLLPLHNADLLFRLDEYLASRTQSDLGNPSQLLDDFAISEGRRRARHQRRGFAAAWAWSVIVPSAFGLAASFGNVVGWVLMAIPAAASIAACAMHVGVASPDALFLTPGELADRRSSRQTERERLSIDAQRESA
ncbi:MAG: dCTP deaminase [Acidimicrobiales bacterium]